MRSLGLEGIDMLMAAEPDLTQRLIADDVAMAKLRWSSHVLATATEEVMGGRTAYVRACKKLIQTVTLVQSNPLSRHLPEPATRRKVKPKYVGWCVLEGSSLDKIRQAETTLGSFLGKIGARELKCYAGAMKDLRSAIDRIAGSAAELAPSLVPKPPAPEVPLLEAVAVALQDLLTMPQDQSEASIAERSARMERGKVAFERVDREREAASRSAGTKIRSLNGASRRF